MHQKDTSYNIILLGHNRGIWASFLDIGKGSQHVCFGTNCLRFHLFYENGYTSDTVWKNITCKLQIQPDATLQKLH